MVINVGDQCQGSVMGDREQNAQNPFTRLLKFKDIRYVKHYQGEIVYTVRILQVIAILITFLSWIIVIFADFHITSFGLTEFREQILGYPNTTGFSKSEVFKNTIKSFTALQTHYMIFYPYLVKLVLDCVVMFHNLYILWDVNLVPSNVSITNYFALTRLS